MYAADEERSTGSRSAHLRCDTSRGLNLVEECSTTNRKSAGSTLYNMVAAVVEGIAY